MLEWIAIIIAATLCLMIWGTVAVKRFLACRRALIATIADNTDLMRAVEAATLENTEEVKNKNELLQAHADLMSEFMRQRKSRGVYREN